MLLDLLFWEHPLIFCIISEEESCSCGAPSVSEEGETNRACGKAQVCVRFSQWVWRKPLPGGGHRSPGRSREWHLGLCCSFRAILGPECIWGGQRALRARHRLVTDTPCKEASSQQHGHLGLPPAPRGPTCSLRARCCLKPLASTTFLFCSWATQPLLTSGLMPPGASTSQEHCLPRCSLPAPSLLPGAALGQADFAGGLFPSSGHAKSQQWLPDMMPQPQRGAGWC